jgi:hypothetical protein
VLALLAFHLASQSFLSCAELVLASAVIVGRCADRLVVPLAGAAAIVPAFLVAKFLLHWLQKLGQVFPWVSPEDFICCH